MTAPSWMAYRVRPTDNPGIPPMTTAEERAYCAVHGIVWYPRRKFTPFSHAPHPRSAYRTLPTLPAKIRNLPLQLEALR